MQLQPEVSPTGTKIRKVEGDIIVVADTQVYKDAPTDHLIALSEYIWQYKPAHLVHIGDHWDFPSLSSYATDLEKEGRRLVDDLYYGHKALGLITQVIREKNVARKKRKAGPYKPTMDFITGNHENRLDRLVGSSPHLIGLLDLPEMIRAFGWDVHAYLEPAWIGDIAFNHFMPNQQSGRAVGGAIENKLNKFPHCFIHGHQQQFQYARRQNLMGKPHFGACAGAFYMHDEGYRGACNTEIRGFLHLKAFINRYGYQDFDLEFVSMERLLSDFSS